MAYLYLFVTGTEDLLAIDGGRKPVMPDDPLHDAHCVMNLQGNGSLSSASHITSSIILPSNDLGICNATEHRHTRGLIYIYIHFFFGLKK